MSRSEYIARQKEVGRKAVAALPIHYPKEILTALDVLAVELWGPPGPPRADDAARLQTYVCPLARNALAFLASGGADAVDGVVFPHTCDSIQGLATLAPDLGGWSKPAFVFTHPKGAARDSARRFLERELRAFAAAIEAFTGKTLTLDRLDRAVRLHVAIDARRAELLAGRARSSLGDPELYRLLRRGEWLWPEEHLAELESACAGMSDAPVQRGVPLLVSGYVPEPAGVLDAMDSAGAYVAADDYAAVGRRIPRGGPGGGADPWAALAARYWRLPPCSTRSADVAARVRHLTALADESGARGVILHLVKFCEPELFDVPAIRAAFAARGTPVLLVESELEREPSAQTVTRLEAFVEMLSSQRRSA